MDAPGVPSPRWGIEIQSQGFSSAWGLLQLSWWDTDIFKENMEQLFSLKGWEHCGSASVPTLCFISLVHDWNLWLFSACLFLVRVYRFPALKSWEGLDCLIQTSYSEVPCHVANLGHKLGFQSCFWALSLKFLFCIGPGVWVMSSKCK